MVMEKGKKRHGSKVKFVGRMSPSKKLQKIAAAEEENYESFTRSELIDKVKSLKSENDTFKVVNLLVIIVFLCLHFISLGTSFS